MLNLLELLNDFCSTNIQIQATLQQFKQDKLKANKAVENIKQIIKDADLADSLLEKLAKNPQVPVKQNQVFYVNKLIYTQKFTKPPGRYSAASLVKKLEDLGIGRPSTYASTISTLQDRGYVEAGGGSMVPTNLGLKINLLLKENFEQVTNSDLTAQMEENLDLISQGKKQYGEVLSQFWQPFKAQVENNTKNLVQDRQKYRSSKAEISCPTCNGEMELKLGRFGEYYQCLSQREHQFAKNFREYEVALTNAYQQFQTQTFGKKCQECGKDLIVRVSKSTLKPYIACPEYKVGNKHTITDVNYGHCPQCQSAGRDGVLFAKTARRGGQRFLACSLPKETCGFVAAIKATQPTPLADTKETIEV